MPESSLNPRPPRKRSTHAVLSDLDLIERWWAPQQPAPLVELQPDAKPVRRQLAVEFRSGDPLEYFRIARYGIACLSLLIPLILIYRLDGAQVLIRKWSFNPIAAARSAPMDQLEEAIPNLRAAVAAAPDNVELLRKLALATAKISPSEARRCYNKLDQLGATQLNDRAAHATILAHLHDFRGAKAVLTKVSGESKSAPVIQHAWLDIWQESGDFAAAVSTLDELTKVEGCQLTTCLDLAEAATKNPISPEVHSRIEQHLTKALNEASKSQSSGLITSVAPRLAALPWQSAPARLQVAQVLRSLPNNPAEFRMAAVRLQFGSSPSGSEREALQKAWFEEISASGGMSAQEKDRVASYLQQQSEHELVAELISVPEAISEHALYQRRIESLLELGRWKEVGSMNAMAGAPMLPQSRLLMQSLSSLHKPGPQTCVADRLLADAFNESREEKRASACYATGCAALDHRLPILASQAFATALDLSKDRHGLMESIINRSRQSPLTITQLLRSLEGSATNQDESVQNQVIYLHLLADRDLDSMIEIIRNRRQLNPGDVYLRFLDALATCKHGEFTQAARMLVPLPRYRWHQGEAAVIASIVAAAGNYDRSASLLGQIDTTKLFPEEQALVTPWQQRIATGGQLVTNLIDDGEK